MATANPLEYAIQMERDGLAYYMEAARKTANPLGKKMFEALAADERDHEAILTRVAQKMDITIGDDLPKRRLVTLFGTLGEELKGQMDASDDDNAVIERALVMERAAVDHYRKLGADEPDEKYAAVYQRLVEEETQHVEILQNTRTYLNDTGHWFFWDEQSILDGG
jgi:rubrerythrin